MSKTAAEVKQLLIDQGAKLDDLQTTQDDVQAKVKVLIERGEGATPEELQEIFDIGTGNTEKIASIKADLQTTVPAEETEETGEVTEP